MAIANSKKVLIAKKTRRKPVVYPVVLEVKYVPLPAERVTEWRDGMRMLLELLHKERENKSKKEMKTHGEKNSHKSVP
jgi:hypothetical protein